ncbi:solute carrier family 23 member 1-like isoform X2 [Varroa jacobsoni]|uniref:solute carrier family 23 member 1-like isoform X2 n=1 Tax=Varroa jacobsoni TaxID=62625 RepID=UPI000BF67941|nr:solute carrier family 23 member 1-like isoform X2 [Varroa jacobsoni]
MDNPTLNLQESPSSPDVNVSLSAYQQNVHLDALSKCNLQPMKSDGSNHKADIVYTVDDVPPWYLCIALGFQHYLTMMGGTLSYPFIVAPKLCIPENHPARGSLISTIFFVSGIGTLLQATFGVRLPIVQGSTFSFLVPIIAILSLPKWECPSPEELVNRTHEEVDDLWMPRMREIQGAIIGASLIEVVVGALGLAGLLMRVISPLTVTPTIALIGLSLFPEAAKHAETNWPISFATFGLVVLLSQYLRDVSIPVPFIRTTTGAFKRYEVFKIFPFQLPFGSAELEPHDDLPRRARGLCLVVLTITTMWFICFLLTVSNATDLRNPLRTDLKNGLLDDSPWVRVPYPFQWGAPTFSLGGVVGVFAGVIISVIESVGDYYACARLAAVRVPPVDAVNRGIAIEGLGSIISAIFGSGCGLTSYSENIGAIGITRVASRRVIQMGAALMVVFGCLGKVGGLFVSIPEPIVGGVFIVMFSVVSSVGLSNLQFVDLNSSRNLFILGASLFLGLCIPSWVADHPKSIDLGNEVLTQLVRVLLSTSMFVGGFVGIVLDNTIPGTSAERGLSAWATYGEDGDDESTRNDKKCSISTYDPPFVSRLPAWTKQLPFMPGYNRKSQTAIVAATESAVPQHVYKVNEYNGYNHDTKL